MLRRWILIVLLIACGTAPAIAANDVVVLGPSADASMPADVLRDVK